MNVEHRTFNIERRMNVFCLFKNRFREAIPSFVIRYSTSNIRYSAVLCLIPGHRNGQSNHHETVPFWGSFIRGLITAHFSPASAFTE